MTLFELEIDEGYLSVALIYTHFALSHERRGWGSFLIQESSANVRKVFC